MTEKIECCMNALGTDVCLGKTYSPALCENKHATCSDCYFFTVKGSHKRFECPMCHSEKMTLPFDVKPSPRLFCDEEMPDFGSSLLQHVSIAFATVIAHEQQRGNWIPGGVTVPFPAHDVRTAPDLDVRTAPSDWYLPDPAIHQRPHGFDDFIRRRHHGEEFVRLDWLRLAADTNQRQYFYHNHTRYDLVHTYDPNDEIYVLPGSVELDFADSDLIYVYAPQDDPQRVLFNDGQDS